MGRYWKTTCSEPWMTRLWKDIGNKVDLVPRNLKRTLIVNPAYKQYVWVWGYTKLWLDLLILDFSESQLVSLHLDLFFWGDFFLCTIGTSRSNLHRLVSKIFGSLPTRLERVDVLWWETRKAGVGVPPVGRYFEDLAAKKGEEGFVFSENCRSFKISRYTSRYQSWKIPSNNYGHIGKFRRFFRAIVPMQPDRTMFVCLG